LTPGYWDPISCQIDENGQPYFRTSKGCLRFFNRTTDIALLFLTGLETLGTVPPELTKAYVPMWKAANTPGDNTYRQKENLAAAALLNWARNLTSDSPAIACLPEELRMVLPRTFGINMSERPAGPMNYLQMPCFQKYNDKVGEAISRHYVDIQQQYRVIQAYMGPQLTADDHPVRALQLHQAAQHQKQAEIAAAQRATQQQKRLNHKMQQQQEELQKALLMRKQPKLQEEQAFKLLRQQQEQQARLQQQQQQQQEHEQQARELLCQQQKELEQQTLLCNRQQQLAVSQHVSKAAPAAPTSPEACRGLPPGFDTCKPNTRRGPPPGFEGCKSAPSLAGLKALLAPPLPAEFSTELSSRAQQHLPWLQVPCPDTPPVTADQLPDCTQDN
jgi:hypothetical protein